MVKAIKSRSNASSMRSSKAFSSRPISLQSENEDFVNQYYGTINRPKIKSSFKSSEAFASKPISLKSKSKVYSKKSSSIKSSEVSSRDFGDPAISFGSDKRKRPHENIPLPASYIRNEILKALDRVSREHPKPKKDKKQKRKSPNLGIRKSVPRKQAKRKSKSSDSSIFSL